MRDSLLDDQISRYEIEIRKALRRVGEEHPATPFLRKVLDEHIELRALRHDVVHGFWSAIGPDEEYLVKRKRRGCDDTMRTLSLEELERGWRKLDELGLELINASRAFEGKDILGV